MAISALITLLDNWGISATQEFPGGTWGHTPEYVALRGRGVRGLIRVLLVKAADGNPRARLQLALVQSKNLDAVDAQIERESL